jgi:hypothetical protein
MRPSHTLILAQRGILAKADFDASTPPKLLEVHVQRAHDSGDVTDTFLAALDLASGGGRKVWLLSEDLWIQNVTIPTHSTTGLDSRGIKRILAYESEPLSGIPAKDTALGFTLEIDDPQTRTYAIVQAPNSLIDALGARVERDGSELAGMAHPSAFGNDWRQLLPDDRPKIGEFLSSAMKRFLEIPVARPLIFIDARPIKTSKLVLAGLAVEAAVIALCVWHGLGLSAERSQLEGNSESGKKHAQQRGELEKKSREKQAELDKLKKTNQEKETELNEHEARIEVQRRALGALLKKIAETRTDNIMLQKLSAGSTHEGPLTLEALALQPGDADAWAAKLSEELGPSGWDIQPLQKKALNRLADGGPWNVTFSLNRLTALAKKSERPALIAKQPEVVVPRKKPPLREVQ